MMLPLKSNAQSWVIRRAIDRKIEHKVDSAVDKSDKDEAKKKQQADQNQADKTTTTEKKGTKASGRGLFGGKIDIKYEDEYKFTGRIYMQMESYDKKNNPIIKMETKEINENVKHSISTKGYTFMKMNFGQAGKK